MDINFKNNEYTTVTPWLLNIKGVLFFGKKQRIMIFPRIDVNVTYLLMEIGIDIRMQFLVKTSNKKNNKNPFGTSVKRYFLTDARLYGIVVLYDYPIGSSLNGEYMFGVENVLKELSLDYKIVLQWIRIDNNSVMNATNTKNLLHQHVETGSQV